MILHCTRTLTYIGHELQLYSAGALAIHDTGDSHSTGNVYDTTGDIHDTGKQKAFMIHENRKHSRYRKTENIHDTEKLSGTITIPENYQETFMIQERRTHS